MQEIYRADCPWRYPKVPGVGGIVKLGAELQILTFSDPGIQ
jgi:hypothetical protein